MGTTRGNTSNWAYLRSAQLDAKADYLQRGRPFENIELAALKATWADAYRAWVAGLANDGVAPDPGDQRKLFDLEAELQLHGEAPPHELTPDADAQFRALGSRWVESYAAGGDAVDAADQAAAAAIDDFLKRPKS